KMLEDVESTERRPLHYAERDALRIREREPRRGDRVISWPQRRLLIEKNRERRFTGAKRVERVENRLPRNKYSFTISHLSAFVVGRKRQKGLPFARILGVF